MLYWPVPQFDEEGGVNFLKVGAEQHIDGRQIDAQGYRRGILQTQQTLPLDVLVELINGT